MRTPRWWSDCCVRRHRGATIQPSPQRLQPGGRKNEFGWWDNEVIWLQPKLLAWLGEGGRWQGSRKRRSGRLNECHFDDGKMVRTRATSSMKTKKELAACAVEVEVEASTLSFPGVSSQSPYAFACHSSADPLPVTAWSPEEWWRCFTCPALQLAEEKSVGEDFERGRQKSVNNRMIQGARMEMTKLSESFHWQSRPWHNLGQGTPSKFGSRRPDEKKGVGGHNLLLFWRTTPPSYFKSSS